VTRRALWPLLAALPLLALGCGRRGRLTRPSDIKDGKAPAEPRDEEGEQ